MKYPVWFFFLSNYRWNIHVYQVPMVLDLYNVYLMLCILISCILKEMNWIRIYWYLSESDSVYAYRTLPVPSQVKQCLLQLLHYPYEVHKLWWFWEFQQCDPHRVPHLSELCMHSPLYEGINICISKPHNYTTSLNTNYHLYKSFMI